MIKRIFIASGLLLLLGSCNSKPEPYTEGSEKKDIAYRTAGDPELQRLKDTAQKELPYLINFMSEHKADSMYEFYVKSPFLEGEKTEHMWSFVTEFKDNHFRGFLANDPVDVHNLKNGDTVMILRSDVEDWLLNDYVTKTKVGGFSQKYLETH